MDLLDGKYRLEGELSRGGTGVVHLATHVLLDKRVAIKVLHEDPDGASSADHTHQRFLQEARATAGLAHPNVVHVSDFGIDGDRPYLVMELLDGESLRARLEREGTLDLPTTIEVVTGIAAALDAAHAAGIVHRDLKPENVFLVAGGPVKVLDFGVAKVATAPTTITTQHGGMLGTPAYMSPEQMQDPRDVDASSDRWALGVIAYECLLGERPFTGESFGELVLEICTWPLPTPSQHGTVPAGFDAWFRTACARERSARFPSAIVQARQLASPPAPRRGSKRVGLVAVAVAGLATVGLAIRSTSHSAPSAPLRIAVLPIEASDPTLETSASSATDELTTRLAGQSGVHVIARASVQRWRGRLPAELGGVATELGADRLLVGHLSHADAGLELELELIEPDQTVAWKRSYTRPEPDLQGTCGVAVIDLAHTLGSPVVPAAPSRIPAAYRAYRTGRDYWARRDEASLRAAIRSFEEALRIDPSYAAAWVGLADAWLLLTWSGTTPRDEVYRRTKAALDRALALAPDASDAHASLGNYLFEAEWDFVGAEREFRRAIELDPDNPTAHQWLGESLTFFRRHDEALAELVIARELDPLAPAIHRLLGRTYEFSGHFAECVAAEDRALALDPSQPYAHLIKGLAQVELGHDEEGLASIAADPICRIPGFLAANQLWAAKRRGDTATVARLREEIAHTDLAQELPFEAAWVAANIGDRTALLAHIEHAIAVHDPWIPLIAVRVEFDPYRSDPAFMALVHRIGL